MTFVIWLTTGVNEPGGMTNVEAVSEMLKPFDARLMTCYPVSNRINYVANDDAECSAPVELTETQAGLFS